MTVALNELRVTTPAHGEVVIPLPRLSRAQMRARLVDLANQYRISDPDWRKGLTYEAYYIQRALAGTWRFMSESPLGVFLLAYEAVDGKLEYALAHRTGHNYVDNGGMHISGRDARGWCALPPLCDIAIDQGPTKAEIRQRALAKLTPEEREALGV